MHIRSNQGFSVLLKDASTGNLTSNLLITKRLLYLLYHCRFFLLKGSLSLPPWPCAALGGSGLGLCEAPRDNGDAVAK